MRLTLKWYQTLELILLYYEVTEGIKVELDFDITLNHDYRKVIPYIHKELEVDGIKQKVTEELDQEKLKEIFGSFLSENYNIDRVLLTSEPYMNYDTYTVEEKGTVGIVFEPVKQKTLGRHK